MFWVLHHGANLCAPMQNPQTARKFGQLKERRLKTRIGSHYLVYSFSYYGDTAVVLEFTRKSGQLYPIKVPTFLRVLQSCPLNCTS